MTTSFTKRHHFVGAFNIRRKICTLIITRILCNVLPRAAMENCAQMMMLGCPNRCLSDL